VVAGAGWFGGFFDAVVVVAGAFDRAGAGPFAAWGVEQAGDGAQQCGQRLIPVLRGNVRRTGGGAADQAQGLGEGNPVGIQIGGRGPAWVIRAAMEWWTISQAQIS
jgi:hypothetical protein